MNKKDAIGNKAGSRENRKQPLQTEQKADHFFQMVEQRDTLIEEETDMNQQRFPPNKLTTTTATNRNITTTDHHQNYHFETSASSYPQQKMVKQQPTTSASSSERRMTHFGVDSEMNDKQTLSENPSHLYELEQIPTSSQTIVERVGGGESTTRTQEGLSQATDESCSDCASSTQQISPEKNQKTNKFREKTAKNQDSPRNAYGAPNLKNLPKNDHSMAQISAPRNQTGSTKTTRFPFKGLSIDVDSDSDQVENAPKVPFLAGNRYKNLNQHQISTDQLGTESEEDSQSATVEPKKEEIQADQLIQFKEMSQQDSDNQNEIEEQEADRLVYMHPLASGEERLKQRQQMTPSEERGISYGNLVEPLPSSKSQKTHGLKTQNQQKQQQMASQQKSPSDYEAQYYHYQPRSGQIRFGQQSQSRASDQIYEKGPEQSQKSAVSSSDGLSNSLDENEDFSGQESNEINDGTLGGDQSKLTREDLQEVPNPYQYAEQVNIAQDDSIDDDEGPTNEQDLVSLPMIRHNQNHPNSNQTQTSQSGGDIYSEQSENSDERAARLLHEDQIEYELRRLEQLNQQEAARLHEPYTTDESAQNSHRNNHSVPLQQAPLEMAYSSQGGATRNNGGIVDQNLLDNLGDYTDMAPVSVLQTSGTAENNSNTLGGGGSDLHLKEKETLEMSQKVAKKPDDDLNDRDGDFRCDDLSAEQLQALQEGRSFALPAVQNTNSNSLTMSNNDVSENRSRKLYVITEESTSMAGGVNTVSHDNFLLLQSNPLPSNNHTNDYGTPHQNPSNTHSVTPLNNKLVGGASSSYGEHRRGRLSLDNARGQRKGIIGPQNNTTTHQQLQSLDMMSSELQQKRAQHAQTLQKNDRRLQMAYEEFLQNEDESELQQQSPLIQGSKESAKHAQKFVSDQQNDQEEVEEIEVANRDSLEEDEEEIEDEQVPIASDGRKVSTFQQQSKPDSNRQMQQKSMKQMKLNLSEATSSQPKSGSQTAGGANVIGTSTFKPPNLGLGPSQTFSRQTSAQEGLTQQLTGGNHKRMRFESVKVSAEKDGVVVSKQPSLQQKTSIRTHSTGQDIRSIYLRENTNITPQEVQRILTSSMTQGAYEGRLNADRQGSTDHPFEVISDEDLLASNFDRISKILPNQDGLIDFTCDESISPPRRGTVNNSQSEKDGANQTSLPLSATSHIKLFLKEINRLEQVIRMKDNTIHSLQESQHNSAAFGGGRKSHALSNHGQTDCKDAQIQAKPATQDSTSQTHGPRKKAYYDSIPAKVNTNLRTRSPSFDQQFMAAGSASVRVKYRSIQNRETFSTQVKEQSPSCKAFNTQRKSETSQSPSKMQKQTSASDASITIDQENRPCQASSRQDVRSLRMQLKTLKTQLNDQENDNLTLIERITSLNALISDYEAVNNELDCRLSEKLKENQDLETKIEDIQRQVDSLLAEKAEWQWHQDKLNVLTNDIAIQTIKEEPWQRPESDTVHNIAVGNGLRRNLATQESQTEEIDLKELMATQIQNGNLTSQSPSMTINNSHLAAMGLIQSNQHSINKNETITELASEAVISEIDSYRGTEQKKIENEIGQYQRILQEMATQITPHSGEKLPPRFQIKQQPMKKSGKKEMNKTDLQNVQRDFSDGVSSRENRMKHHPQNQMMGQSFDNVFSVQMNNQQTIPSAENTGKVDRKFAGVFGVTNNIGGAHHTMGNAFDLNSNGGSVTGLIGAAATNQSMVQQNQQLAVQQVSWLSQQYTYYKRKSKKLDKKVTKLEFEKLQTQRILEEFQGKQTEMNERYRDLKQKFQLKLQEKNLKISELKAQLNQLDLLRRNNNTLNSNNHSQLPMQMTSAPPTTTDQSFVNYPPEMVNQSEHLQHYPLQQQQVPRILANQNHVHMNSNAQIRTVGFHPTNFQQQQMYQSRDSQQPTSEPRQASQNNNESEPRIGLSTVVPNSQGDSSTVHNVTNPGEFIQLISGIVDKKIAQKAELDFMQKQRERINAAFNQPLKSSIDDKKKQQFKRQVSSSSHDVDQPSVENEVRPRVTSQEFDIKKKVSENRLESTENMVGTSSQRGGTQENLRWVKEIDIGSSTTPFSRDSAYQQNLIPQHQQQLRRLSQREESVSGSCKRTSNESRTLSPSSYAHRGAGSIQRNVESSNFQRRSSPSQTPQQYEFYPPQAQMNIQEPQAFSPSDEALMNQYFENNQPSDSRLPRSFFSEASNMNFLQKQRSNSKRRSQSSQKSQRKIISPPRKQLKLDQTKQQAAQTLQKAFQNRKTVNRNRENQNPNNLVLTNQRGNWHVQRSLSARKSSKSRATSQKSGKVSKDQVMPCYKSKFEGRKRVDIDPQAEHSKNESLFHLIGNRSLEEHHYFQQQHSYIQERNSASRHRRDKDMLQQLNRTYQAPSNSGRQYSLQNYSKNKLEKDQTRMLKQTQKQERNENDEVRMSYPPVAIGEGKIGRMVREAQLRDQEERQRRFQAR